MLYRRSLALSLVNVTLFVTISATFLFGLFGLVVNIYTQPESAFERVISNTSGIVAISVAFALYGLATKRRKVQLGGALVLLLAALHSLLVNLSIASVFYLDFLNQIDAYFYPPVALTFLILGVTLLLNPREKIQRRWMRVFAVFLLFVACVSIVLHFLPHGFAYLGPHPPVTTLATLSIFLTGLSLLLASSNRILLFDLNANPAAWLTFAFVAFICSLWVYLSLNQIRDIRNEAVTTIEKVAESRKQTIVVNMQILNRLRERWTELELSPTSAFARFDAATFLRDIPHYLGIHLLDERGVPQWQLHRNNERAYLEQISHPEVQSWLASPINDIAMMIPPDEFKSDRKPVGLMLVPVAQEGTKDYYLLVVFDLVRLVNPDTRVLPDFLKIYASLGEERQLSFENSKPRHRNELAIASAELNIPYSEPVTLSASLYSFANLSSASNLRMILAFSGFLFCVAFLALSQQNRMLRKHSLRLRGIQQRLHDQQRQLQLNEQQFRSLFTFHPDAVYSLDTDGLITSANHAVLSNLEAAPEQVIGAHFSVFVRPNDRKVAETNFKQALAGETCQYELNVYTSQGEQRSIVVTNLPIKIDDEITGVFGIAKDVTRDKAKDAQLQILERSMNVTSNGIIISDAGKENAPIIYANQAFQRMTGYYIDEIAGKSCDFLIGPKTDPKIITEVRQALESKRECHVEVLHYRKDGSSFWDQLELTPVTDAGGKVTHFIGIHEDISERYVAKQQLAFQAEHDALTSLFNRRSFEHRLSAELQETGATQGKQQWAVMFIDLDGFKSINEAMGLEAGDLVLQLVAKRIQAALNPPGFAARFGGDEFVVAVREESPNHVAVLGERLLEIIAEPYEVRKQKVYLTASIGVACFDDNSQSAVSLMQHADLAMTMAKRQGRNYLNFYQQCIEQTHRFSVHLRSKFQQAIDNEQLQLFYQPIVALSSGKIIGAEALMRWQLEDGSFIPPDIFIPMAETTGQIIPASQWALEQACHDLSQLLERRPGFCLAVNLSALQFNRANFFEQVITTLQSHHIPSECIELELTESILMDDSAHAIKLIERFRQAGLSVAIDDFGTGFSSLSYLKKLPVSKLKIDRAFIQEVVNKASDEAIVRGILAMARQLNIKVVAEGIEMAEQAIRLNELGCDLGQGYYFAKPKPLNDLLNDLD
ncbi:EAL domain-containing protein [Pseudidiomarina insulisalsae]|uniref:Bifunctional diguanylate cyclase/phosphodiesterase n=1 Tax=Pseudidiomarina insulisalsae TaxID=575789 RepID=A0A432YMM1_9GAMM|nr:EAL domain-containing protein [Pseudidiomarina insulisalsae]RUO62183.1 hypothetical protein CWI71_04845 [Pseudidiomarina insulisalsae]